MSLVSGISLKSQEGNQTVHAVADCTSQLGKICFQPNKHMRKNIIVLFFCCKHIANLDYIFYL